MICFRNLAAVFCFVAWCGAGGFDALAADTPDSPKIDKIELLGFDQVTIHFDTQPDLNYELQYSEDALWVEPDGPAPTWVSLFLAPAFPFKNHFIIVDSIVRSQRVYRLKITP